jgi:urease accessory protein
VRAPAYEPEPFDEHDACVAKPSSHPSPRKNGARGDTFSRVMQTLTHILGYATDHDIAHQLHRLAHDGAVHYLTLSKQDTLRHRLRAITDRGDEIAIALPRAEQLANGAVLLLEAGRAVVVRMEAERWLVLKVRDTAAALEVGYFAGNMHWQVKFEDDALRIVIEGPEQGYLDRLHHLISDGRAWRVDA